MSIDVNVQNDLVIVTESSEDITVNVSNAAGPAGVGVPTGGTTGQVLKKLSNTNYDTYWALDGGGVPYSGATGDVNLGEFQLRAGQLTLDTSPTGTAAVGTTRWNDAIGSSETTLKGGNVILKNGVDLVARVVNKVSPNTTLTKAAYQAVRVSGAQGQRLAVQLAQANNDANSADTIGLVCETIATNQEGFIITVGQLENINTTGSLQGETWADGDVLYLSPTTPGAITKVKPTGNGHIVVIGYVEYAHANNGKIYVKVMNGWELTELHDCDIVSAANNEALIYESSTSLWKNKTIATALGYTPISGTGATGQVAYWNGTNSQTGSNNLFWDAANARLGIGTNSPSSTLDIRGKARLQASGNCEFDFNDGSQFLRIGVSSTSGFLQTLTSIPLGFFTGALKRGEFSTNGNFILQNGGTFTDGGQRLQVYGDAFIKGSGATSATTALRVENSASTPMLSLLNNGYLRFGSSFRVYPSSVSGAGDVDLGGEFLVLNSRSATTETGGGLGHLTIGGVVILGTSGIYNNASITRTFAPTSGNAVYNIFNFTSVINQTGGANGITRGLYVNPTLTAAADWRSIEWSNNSGWGLYGAGTANNFLGGNLTISRNQNAGTTLTINNTTSGTSAGTKIVFGNDGNNAACTIEKLSSTTTPYKFVASSDYAIYNGNISTNGDICIFNDRTAGIIKFGAGSSSTAQMTLTAAGRLLLGLTAESTFLLDVNGTARVSGATTLRGITNNDTTVILQVSQANGNGRFAVSANAQTVIGGDSFQATENFVTIARNAFNPTSGSTTHTSLFITPVINQTGGASGITRGLLISPLLTSASDWRAIEVSAGVSVLAPSTTASATLRIPSGTAPTSPVNGDIWFDGTDLKMRIGGVTKTFTLV